MGPMGKIIYLVCCWCSMCVRKHMFYSSKEEPHGNDILELLLVLTLQTFLQKSQAPTSLCVIP